MYVTIQEAKHIINAVHERWISLGRNPDTLYMYDNHIYGAAKIAQTIAAKTDSIDHEKAYVKALLHDIAKIDESPESMVGRFHGLLGYEMFKDRDPGVARACLLHEFPWNKVALYEKKFLGNKDDYEFTLDYVTKHPLQDEDLLIQLADGMANKNGLVTLEQRREEYEARFKIKLPTELTESYLEIKKHFDKKLGFNIYDLFPELSANKSQSYLPNSNS